MLPRQQDVFSKPAKLCQTRCCLVRSHLLYIRYPSNYPRLSGDLLLPSLCHCALRRLSAVIWDETLVDSMLGTLVATFDHPSLTSETLQYVLLVFQPIFWPRKIGYVGYGCNFLNHFDLSQAICPSTRVGTGSTRPVRHWVSASLERWCPLAKLLPGSEVWKRGDVPSLPYYIMYIVLYCQLYIYI